MNLKYIVPYPSLGGVAACHQEANCCRTSSVHVGNSVDIGPRIDEKLCEFRQIERDFFAVRLNAV